MRFFGALIVALFVQSTYATQGFDAIQPISTSTFQCMANSGIDFFIGRVYRSNGQVDSHGIQNIQNAYSAGFSQVDGYIFPCRSCDPAAQIDALTSAINSAGVNIRYLWIDVEVNGAMWDYSTADNVNFISALQAEATLNGFNVGIYTRGNYWQSITGDSTAFSTLPLWWNRYNGVQDFSNYSPFGGWNLPIMRQYNENQAACGINYDPNWQP